MKVVSEFGIWAELYVGAIVACVGRQFGDR